MQDSTRGTALVTGGSGGIGAAIRTDLLAAGYHVLNLDVRACDEPHPRLQTHVVDLADLAATRALARALAGDHAITTLIHNVGVIRPARLPEVKQEDYEFLSRLHVGALIALGQACLPAMQAAGFGRIVSISSRAVLGLETRTAYSATKAAQIGLTRTWALELGRYGVTVNAIAPGPIVTDQFRAVVPEGDPREEAIATGLPVRRIGRPGDVSRVVLFLIEPASGFITGQTWYVCGGASLGSLAL